MHREVLAIQPQRVLFLSEEWLCTPAEVLRGQVGATVPAHLPSLDKLHEASVQIWMSRLLGESLPSPHAVLWVDFSYYSPSVLVITAA